MKTVTRLLDASVGYSYSPLTTICGRGVSTRRDPYANDQHFENYTKLIGKSDTIINIAHSNATKAKTEENHQIMRKALSGIDPLTLITDYPQTFPEILERQILEQMVSKMRGMEGVTSRQLTTAPQTMTLLNKFVVMARKEQLIERGVPADSKFVVLRFEGWYRDNYMNDGISGVETRRVPMNPETLMSDRASLNRTFEECKARGEVPVLVNTEMPSNPFMQVYADTHVRPLLEEAKEWGVPVHQDGYLMHTESIGCSQVAIRALAPDKMQVSYAGGARRPLGLDDKGKFGFLVADDPDFMEKVKRLITHLLVKHKTGDILASTATLREYTGEKSLREREASAKSREEIEAVVTDSCPNLYIPVPAKTGPFTTIMVTADTQESLRKLGIDNGIKLAIALAENGVLIMPLDVHHVRDDFMGGRINAEEPACREGVQRVSSIIKDIIVKGITFEQITSSTQFQQSWRQASEMIHEHRLFDVASLPGRVGGRGR